jgi:hypothetical protein
MPYTEVFEAFPEELRPAVARLVDALNAALAGERTDFEALRGAVQELAAAQTRTEARLEELVPAQTHTQDEPTLSRRTFLSQIGGLGARWGLQTEGAFRHGMRTILADIGFTTERFLPWDAAGEVFGHPEHLDLDVVVRNGKVVRVEIKSALDRANTYLFERKVTFSTQHTGRQGDRKVIVTSYADEPAREVARRWGIEVCTDVTELH